MSSISVLHLITRFRDGGAETTTVNELTALEAAHTDYELHLGYGFDSDPSAVENLAPLDIETVQFGQIRHYSILHTLPAVVQVAVYLRRHRIDVLHTHSTEAGIIGRWAAALVRTSTIIHEIHGDPITEDRPGLLNQFVLMMERLAAPLATKLIVKSERIRNEFLSRGIGEPAQYELMYHGINIEAFANQQPAELPDSNANYRILFVGRLADGKGLYDLLEAFKRVKSETNTELLVAGDGPLAEELASQVDESDSSEAVRLLGYRPDVPNLLAAADLLVLPSYREGTPRVISEALASGTPVVSTRIAGIPEQVTDGETGVLYEPGDVEALESAILELLEDEEKRTGMANRCRPSVEKFSQENSAHRLRELYGTLCSD